MHGRLPVFFNLKFFNQSFILAKTYVTTSRIMVVCRNNCGYNICKCGPYDLDWLDFNYMINQYEI